MCVPVAAAYLASAVVTAYGAYQQSRAQKTALNAEAAATNRERVTADERANDQAQHLGAQVSDARGRQLAGLAASGTDMNFGSAGGLQASTDYYGLQDQTTLARNAQDVDFNYRDKSSQLRSSASQISPWMAAGSSLLSSSGKVASSWYNYAGS